MSEEKEEKKEEKKEEGAKPAPKAAAKPSGPWWSKQYFGIPLYVLIGALLLVVIRVGGTAVQNAVGVHLNPTPDTTGLLNVWGASVPIKRVSFPEGVIPLAAATSRQKVAFVLLVIGLILVYFDNITKRGTQAPAKRANMGMLVFFLGIFVPGWWCVVVAVAGLILARRPRLGGQMEVWPVLTAVVLVLYVWFDLIAPLVPFWLAQLPPSFAWVLPFLERLFSADNARILAMGAFMVVMAMSIFEKATDSTTLVMIGMLLLAWYIAFGVFPYAEGITWGNILFWVMFWLIVIELATENIQSGHPGVILAVALVFFVGITIAMAFRDWFNISPVTAAGTTSLGWTLTQPLSFSYLLLLLFGWAFGSGSKNPTISKFIEAVATWAGTFVQVGPLLLPVDATLWANLVFAGLLLGTSLAIL